MSRFKQFAHSLLSGYVLLGANVLYTLASIPLALRYLSKPEFGLWALTTSIAAYLMLIDFGMSGSVSRILIDYKDRRGKGDYGGLIQTGIWVGLAQAILILLIGGLVAIVAAPLLEVPVRLEQEFRWLVFGQCALLAVSFATRIFSHVLTAHQRYDISNYGQALLFGVNFAVTWFCFARGAGVFSIIWGQAAGTLLMVVVNGAGCMRLGLLPRRGEWGRVTPVRFREVFAFGWDIFLFVLGSQLINASQPILLTRLLGLETAAVWNVCTRTYILLTQVIYRIFDYSGAAFAEMIVRGEKEWLLHRFKQVAVVSASLSVVIGALFAVCNGPFVQVWTSGKMSWAPVNDLLLAIWLVISVTVRVHVGLVGQTKAFGFLRYLYFVEGLAFVSLTLLYGGRGGISAMLLTSIICTLIISFPYGLWRTQRYFGLSSAALASWYHAPLRLAACLTPLALIIWWFTRTWSPIVQLAVSGVALGLLSLALLWRQGLEQRLQNELLARAPAQLRWLLVLLGGCKPSAQSTLSAPPVP